MRGLMTGIAVSAAVTVVLVFVIGGDPLAVKIHAMALTASAAVAAFCALLFRQPTHYYRRLALYVIVAQGAVLMTGLYYWGIFSAYIVLCPLSIYIASGSASGREMVIGVGLTVVGCGGFQLSVVLGWIPSRGIVEPIGMRAPQYAQIIAIVLIQLINVGAAIAGRAARRDTIAALDAHNQALLELARREAQLAEAVADARDAREAGLGGIGRFTDQTIDGFRLGPVLGRGAMGEVYAAQRIADDFPVAFKILAPHLMREPDARERFLRESAIVSALASPHIVRVYAVSGAASPLPYIAMERLQGTDLAELLKGEGLRTLEEVRELVVQIGAGLVAAHEAGVIHRDLKPSNVFASTGASRIWKLLDFGASKWSDGEGTLTREHVVGTPGYMAPEQAMGHRLDHRCDIYAFGVILYRLLTGVPAVVPNELPAMLQEVALRMPIQPSKRALVSPQIEAVVAIALAKNPAARWQTAGELARAFTRACDNHLERDAFARARAILADTPWGEWITRRPAPGA